jgi:peroxiredoxin family protein
MVTGEMSPRPVLDKYNNELSKLASKLGVSADRDGLLTAAREAGVPIIACGGWTEILGLQGKLPEGVEIRPIVATLLEAKKVVGGF